MEKRLDLTGQRFGRLIVIEIYKKDKQHHYYYKCKCDCGNYKVVADYNLRNNSTKSCGCLSRENKIKHNKSNTKLYRKYYAMKQRCYNSKYSRYFDYGGRGIKICDEWKNNFMSFYNWAINNGYQENLSIDRIDVNGNYCPENCRWITMEEQQSNTRKSHFIEYNGEKHTIAEWSRIIKVSPNTIRFHLNRGRTIKDVIDYKKRRTLQ